VWPKKPGCAHRASILMGRTKSQFSCFCSNVMCYCNSIKLIVELLPMLDKPHIKFEENSFNCFQDASQYIFIKLSLFFFHYFACITKIVITHKCVFQFNWSLEHILGIQPISTNCNVNLIKTHSSVSCGPRNPGRATDKCVFYRSKENAVFTHL